MEKTNGKKRPPEKIVMAADLPHREDSMPQADNVCTARHVDFGDFLKLFDEQVHEKIRGACLGLGVTHVVCFENLDGASSQFGHRAALVVGFKPAGAEFPTYTIGDVLKTPYFSLGDAPNRLHPVAYASVQALRQALQPKEGDIELPSEDRRAS